MLRVTSEVHGTYAMCALLEMWESLQLLLRIVCTSAPDEEDDEADEEEEDQTETETETDEDEDEDL